MPDKTPEQKTTPTEIEALTSKLETAYQQNAELRSEAAQYRVARNTALKQNSALKTVLEKHNVGFVVETADLSKMTIENGQVEGGFEYTPKGTSHETKAPNQPPIQPSQSGLTLEAVNSMTPSEINKNWDKVQEVLKTAGKG